MAALKFTINPEANFGEKPVRRQSTRDVLWLNQNGRAKHSEALQDVEASTSHIQGQPNTSIAIEAVSREELFTSVVCPSNAINRAKHSKYKRYIISTTLRVNGTWVASYGRPSGPSFVIGGKERAVAETEPYLAEALALADARIGIDERRRNPQVLRSQERQRSIPRRSIFIRTASEEG